MKATLVKPVRCAIYTRVSTEHGLDQEFNSLDAQYDAGSAYIKSQVSIFHAEELKPGQAGWITIDGEIAIDGKAAFVETGLTGVDPRFTKGHTKGGMPYSFPVDAQFNESRGTGKRLMGRPCNLRFGKR